MVAIVVGAILMVRGAVGGRISLLMLLVACGLPPESARRVADCAALYAGCVETSTTMAEYRACRADIDAVCLGDGGAP